MQSNLLDGKVALITGGAQGIGLAVARAFVEQGARVALADIQDEAVAATAEEFGANGLAVTLDVRDEAQQDAAVEATLARFGRLDCAVANAGILLLKHAIDMSADEWRQVLDGNLTGAFLTARAAATRLVTQGEGGRIILTSSLFGLRGGAENAAYSASKFGMIGLAQCLAAELAPHGILVNSVCPGQMDTDMIHQLFRERAALRGVDESEVRAALENRIPVGHLGPLDQLAGTYVYLASDLSRYVTGQAITINGGWQVG